MPPPTVGVRSHRTAITVCPEVRVGVVVIIVGIPLVEVATVLPPVLLTNAILRALRLVLIDPAVTWVVFKLLLDCVTAALSELISEGVATSGLINILAAIVDAFLVAFIFVWRRYELTAIVEGETIGGVRHRRVVG